MLADGAPADVGRGFGLAWDDGVRIPRPERDTMFEEFTQLEVTVGGVLVGRDLRAARPRRDSAGFGAFAQLFGGRSSPRRRRPPPRSRRPASRAAAALVALWNTWVAMRYRASIPAPTFELLTRPWVTVVGRLPDR